MSVGGAPNQAVLTELVDAIRDLFRNQARNMSRAKYMDLYSKVSEMCLATPIPQLGPGSRMEAMKRKHDAIEAAGGNERNVRPTVFTADFQANPVTIRLVTVIETELMPLSQNAYQVVREGGDVLSLYYDTWERFFFNAKVINGICGYLNRSCVHVGIDKCSDVRNQMFNMAIEVWRRGFFVSVYDPVIQNLLGEIRNHREGRVVSITKLRSVITSLVALGDEKVYEDGQETVVSVYQKYFEDQFIQATVAHYQQFFTDLFLQPDYSYQNYFTEVLQRMQSENARVDEYLQVSTRPRLMTACAQVMIENHLPRLQEAFGELLEAAEQEMINGDKDRAATLMMADIYRFFVANRLDIALVRVQNVFRDHVARKGSAALRALGNQRKSVSGMVTETFQKNGEMGEALGNGFRDFINIDTENASAASAQIMALYFHEVLRKGSSISQASRPEGDDVEDGLKTAMTVFRFLHGKDMFMTHYLKFFSRRLLGNLSISSEAELSAISKLKQECGNDYTGKLQVMYMDVELAKTTRLQHFSDWLVRNEGGVKPIVVDFYPLILTTNSWPFSASASETLAMPPELETPMRVYTEYYNERYPTRKLTWLWEKSKVDLAARFGQHTYTLELNTYACALLLLYNSAESYPVNQLATLTRLSDLTVIQIVQYLLRARIFQCKDKVNAINLDSDISLFTDYRNKRLRVPLMQALKVESSAEQARLQAAITAGRKHVTKAAIMRIMKTRKELDQQNLIAETITQVQNRFQASVDLIKLHIDELVKAEYLRVKPGNGAVIYQYIAEVGISSAFPSQQPSFMEPFTLPFTFTFNNHPSFNPSFTF